MPQPEAARLLVTFPLRCTPLPGAAAKVPDLGVGVTLETLFSFATSTEGEGGGAVVAPRDELASGVRDAK